MAVWELIEETASPYRDTNETTTKIGVTLINGTTDYLQLNYATSTGSGMMGKFSTLPIAEYAKAESYLYKIDIHKKVDGVAGPIESTILFTFRNVPAEGQTIGLFAPDITVSKENIYMPFGTGNMISRLYRKALNTNGKVKDQIPGTLIKFAGSIWTILEPTTGYLYKNDSVLQRNFDAENYKYFVPTRVTGLAYWLNNGYFDSFAIQDKAAIKTKEWGTGGAGNENGTLVSAKIGLLSFSEKNWYIDQLKILSPPTSEMWMRTYHGDASKVYTVLPTGGAYLAHATNDKKAVHPTLYIDPEISIKNGAIVHNTAPIASLTSPSNNQTLYENDALNIAGEAYDSDKDQSVTVFYQINSEQRKVLATNVSQTQIALSKQLTFKSGKIYDGEVVLTNTLAEGVAHTLKVWAVDSENGQSATIERTFYVVPNRAPLLAIDEVVPTGILNTDKFKISGTASDQDANSTLTVNYRINAANPIEIYTGTGGAWEFEVSLGQLKVGENIIVVEVVDNYGAKTSKTIKLNKNTVKTPILQSVARYKISPPKGFARGVLIWVQRDEDLDLTVELSMTLVGEQEQYILLEADPDNIVEVSEGIVEDEYHHETVEPKDNIILKLTTSRANVNIDDKIYLVWGVLE